jgi:hypothetical protein
MPSMLKLLNFIMFLKLSPLLGEGSGFKIKFPISLLQPA